MIDRSVLKWGGGAAVVSAALGFVFNILHPRSSEALDSAVGELRLIADSDIWLFDHFMLAWSIGFAAIGLVAIGWSFVGGRAAGWARLATAAAIGSVTVAFVTLAIDGMAMQEVADRWAEAGGDAAATAAAEGIVNVSLALFTATIGSLFGLTPVLFGITSLSSDQHPNWLGQLALGAGLVGLLTASLQYLSGPSDFVTNILFPIASLGFTIWSLVMGLRLWQGRGIPATAEPEVRATVA